MRLSVVSASDTFRNPKPRSRSACAPSSPADASLSPGGTTRPGSEIQGLFRETIAELAVTLPPDLPQAHNSYRFSDTEEFLRLLRGAGLVDVAVAEHATSYCVPDVETLWRGGLGSCVLTGAAIRHQDEATQKRIRAAFERRASVYKSANGLDLPIAFKVGSGRKPI